MTNDDFQTQDDTQADDTGDQKPLAEDSSTPFSVPDDVPTENETDEQLVNQPQTDTGVDQHEEYDAGTATAAGITPPADPKHVLPPDEETVTE